MDKFKLSHPSKVEGAPPCHTLAVSPDTGRGPLLYFDITRFGFSASAGEVAQLRDYLTTVLEEDAKPKPLTEQPEPGSYVYGLYSGHRRRVVGPKPGRADAVVWERPVAAPGFNGFGCDLLANLTLAGPTK